MLPRHSSSQAVLRTCARAWRWPAVQSPLRPRSPHWRRCGEKPRCSEDTMPDTANIPTENVLTRICTDSRAAVAQAKATLSLDALRSKISSRSDTPRGFGAALKQAVVAGGYGLIAEIKKASPSGGLI